MRILVQRDGSISTLQVRNVYIYDINDIETMNIEEFTSFEPGNISLNFLLYFFLKIFLEKKCGNFFKCFTFKKIVH